MKDKSNLFILGIVGLIAVIGIIVMIIGAANPVVYGAASSIDNSLGLALATADSTPRIAYWQGYVNQHISSTGKWTTDPDGKSGSTIDMLTYCKKWYPNTASVVSYKLEAITLWQRIGYTKMFFTSTKMSYRCVQPINKTLICSDSDGGKNYLVKGNVVGVDRYGNGNPGSDYCGTGVNSNILMEGFCDSGYANFISYACPYGCSNGACLNNPTITCKDTDNTSPTNTSSTSPSIFVKGTTTGLWVGGTGTQYVWGLEPSPNGGMISTYNYSLFYDYCFPNSTNLMEGVCTPDGKLSYFGVNCSNGCSNGACLKSSTCTNDCTTSGLKQCSGISGYQTCGNYDTDSCLEWSTITLCPSGQTCSSAGACSTTTQTCKDSDNTPNILNVFVGPADIIANKYPSMYIKGYGTGIYLGSNTNVIIGANPASTLITSSPYNYSIVYDYCDPYTPTRLIETFCTSDGKLGNSGVECPYGCSNGACLKSSEIVCKDTDGTPDISQGNASSDAMFASMYTKGNGTGIYITNNTNIIYGLEPTPNAIIPSPYNYSIIYDHCAPNSTTNLIEAFCTNGRLSSYTLYCQFGCSNGACIRTTNISNTSTCSTGSTRSQSCGAGVCFKTVSQTCSNGVFSPTCVPGTPSTEVCNGLDDNCDGLIDNGLVAPSLQCAVGIGACVRTGIEYKACNGVSGWSSTYSGCSAVAGTPTTEVCDGIDNDCDTVIDEGCTTQQACTDTDGGQNIYVKGQVLLGTTVKDEDYCTNINTLAEYSCNASGGYSPALYGYYRYYNCSYGCSNGACAR